MGVTITKSPAMTARRFIVVMRNAKGELEHSWEVGTTINPVRRLLACRQIRRGIKMAGCKQFVQCYAEPCSVCSYAGGRGGRGRQGATGPSVSRKRPGMKRTWVGNHYQWRRENPCTEVQVFHSEYRENEAKIMAKVAQRL